jgi:hypothetical protein
MKRAKRSVRVWFSATLERLDNGIWSLIPSAGCRRVVIVIPTDPNEACVESSVREPNARLVANLGDHIMCLGGGMDEQAVLEVVGITQGGWSERLSVVIKSGFIASRKVQILRMRPVRKAA